MQLSHSTQHLAGATPAGLIPTNNDAGSPGRVQRRDTLRRSKIDGVRSFLPGEKRAQRDLITALQYLKGVYKDTRGSLFTKSHMEKTKGNQYRLHWRGFVSA